MTQKSYWPLTDDLAELHDAAIEYAVAVQEAAAKRHERTPTHPLSHGSLFTLHWRAIIIHRAIRTLCVAGWTPTVPILIRTLLDIIASCYAIVAKPEDAEFMGFKYMGSYLIQSLKEGDFPPEVLRFDQEQLDKLRAQTNEADVVRIDEFIRECRPQLYWYRPEYESPSAILKTASTDLHYTYRVFSGAVHGGFLGSALFDDTPEAANINPQDHPRRTRLAIATSSRILLEISYMSDRFEGARLEEQYKAIMKDLYLPQKAKLDSTAATPQKP